MNICFVNKVLSLFLLRVFWSWIDVNVLIWACVLDSGKHTLVMFLCWPHFQYFRKSALKKLRVKSTWLRSDFYFLAGSKLFIPYLLDWCFYIYIYNFHGLPCQEKVSRFSMPPIPCNGTSLAVSHWKLRMVLVVGYRSSRLNQNKPFSGPVSTLLSSSAEFYSFSLSGHLHAVVGN